jgi:hypothetical protein
MASRSAGFDDLESGFPALNDHDEPQEPDYAAEENDDEEDAIETHRSSAHIDADEVNELDLAEQEYLREIHSGIANSAEEDFSL